MIHDAYVEVTCDGEGCKDMLEIPMDFVYSNYSAGSGHYDHKESSVEKKLAAKGWAVVKGQHFCEGCTPEESNE